MSTDQNLLTAAPLAFILILPVFFYYCLRTVLVKQDNIVTAFAPETRIPDYLIKQHVDKSRQVRKMYRKLKTKVTPSHSTLKHLGAKTKLLALPTMQILGHCSAGLSKFTSLNDHLKAKLMPTASDSRSVRKTARKSRIHQQFEPTTLTTIYEDVEY